MSGIVDEVKAAPDTFSSWDKCMDKTYCKWPAIIGIVVGSLILLSVLFCLVQCICCGVSCAKMLCCCCNGCDGCCGKGKSSRRDRDDRPSRFKDDYRQMPPTPNPYAGYIPPSTMAPAYRGVPQTAAFEDSKHHNGDSLPAMPTWDTASTRRVEDHSQLERKRPEDLEMGRLNRPTNGGYDQVPLSPTSPGHAAPGYFASQPSHSYQSDLGTQRMSPQPGYDQYSSAQPLSPAPTYTTHAPQNDNFMAGAAAPAPHRYQQHAPSYAPSSTAYEPQHSYHRSQSFSPPPAGTMPSQSYTPYNNNTAGFDFQQTSPRDARPPSLLQVGRKAVPGSTREI